MTTRTRHLTQSKLGWNAWIFLPTLQWIFIKLSWNLNNSQLAFLTWMNRHLNSQPLVVVEGRCWIRCRCSSANYLAFRWHVCFPNVREAEASVAGAHLAVSPAVWQHHPLGTLVLPEVDVPWQWLWSIWVFAGEAQELELEETAVVPSSWRWGFLKHSTGEKKKNNQITRKTC